MNTSTVLTETTCSPALTTTRVAALHAGHSIVFEPAFAGPTVRNAIKVIHSRRHSEHSQTRVVKPMHVSILPIDEPDKKPDGLSIESASAHADGAIGSKMDATRIITFTAIDHDVRPLIRVVGLGVIILVRDLQSESGVGEWIRTRSCCGTRDSDRPYQQKDHSSAYEPFHSVHSWKKWGRRHPPQDGAPFTKLKRTPGETSAVYSPGHFQQ